MKIMHSIPALIVYITILFLIEVITQAGSPWCWFIVAATISGMVWVVTDACRYEID